MKNALFKYLKDEEIEHVIELVQGEQKQYAQHTVIVPYNTLIEKIGIVVQGKIKVVRYNVAGDEVIQAILGVNEMFVESFVFSNKKTSVEVITMKDSEILWISKKSLDLLAKTEPYYYATIIEALLEILANKNIQLNERNNIITQATLEDKVMEYLRNVVREQGSNKVEIEVKQEQLASYLHCHRSALNTTLKKLEEAGKLSYHNQTYELLEEQ